MDEEKLLPGQDWDMEIEKAVEEADAIVVCLSGTSVTKEGYVQKEIKVALNVALYKPEQTIFIVPVRLDDCSLPRNLRSIQYIDYFPDIRKDWARGRLLAGLKKRAGSLGITLDKKVGGNHPVSDIASLETQKDSINAIVAEEIRKLENLRLIRSRIIVLSGIKLIKKDVDFLEQDILKSLPKDKKRYSLLIFTIASPFFLSLSAGLLSLVNRIVSNTFEAVGWNNVASFVAIILIPLLFFALIALEIGAIQRIVMDTEIKTRVADQENKLDKLKKSFGVSLSAEE